MLALPFLADKSAIIALSLFFGLGLSLSTVATGAYAGEIADRKRLGASMGALSAVMDIGHSSGPLATGFIIAWFSMRAGFIASFRLCTITTVVFILTERNYFKNK